MNKAGLSVVAGLVVLSVGAGYLSLRVSQAPLLPAEDALVRGVVGEFGQRLRMVPLLASSSVRAAAVEAYYAPYVSPELVAQWKEASSSALGRATSSPWPERIEVITIQKTGPHAFAVDANVIEVAMYASTTRAVAVYPITLALEERGGKLVITKIDRGAYSELPRHQVVVGYWECLPRKDTSGPNTMECAIGLAVDQSDSHYALNLGLVSHTSVDYPIGTKLRVEGVITPLEELSSSYWHAYDIDGILSATSIEKLR